MSARRRTAPLPVTALHGESGSTQDVQIYYQVFDAILAQRLLPGTKLTEDELADIFAVSRAVVRRALLRLSHDNIVEIRPNRGAVVASPSVGEAREILEARLLIECALVRQVTTCIEPVQLEQLYALIDDEQQCFESGQSGSGIRLSGDFHLRLAQISGNTTLTRFIKQLVPRTSLIIAQYEKKGHALCSHQEHRQIVEVIATGDADSAELRMREHLQRVEAKLNLDDEPVTTDLRQVFSHVIANRQPPLSNSRS